MLSTSRPSISRTESDTFEGIASSYWIIVCVCKGFGHSLTLATEFIPADTSAGASILNGAEVPVAPEANTTRTSTPLYSVVGTIHGQLALACGVNPVMIGFHVSPSY